MSEWYNPSRTSNIWDHHLNQHVGPGQRVKQRPSPDNIRTGKLVEVPDGAVSTFVESAEPLTIAAHLVSVPDAAPGMFDDEPVVESEEQKVSRKGRKGKG